MGAERQEVDAQVEEFLETEKQRIVSRYASTHPFVGALFDKIVECARELPEEVVDEYIATNNNDMLLIALQPALLEFAGENSAIQHFVSNWEVRRLIRRVIQIMYCEKFAANRRLRESQDEYERENGRPY
ncbi:MAG: hypothetical protein ACD_51C00026G0002 [uncultured bacterium]|nr:MAG: hypothetical protein ACD_51C00026G0002 [uncultured bacterium]OGJ48242.1 MAG: hypothetical protein A2244_04290 [Candidatus Peregrinibacteria bacterium RIFOXYA2_FULL_41_18]OGJ48813.1 MAG: hypothetical protein A2344_01645 [Candidatus Peregrinibacteria bacterium RIFOXYB12_FULL_41_12]OGJ54120.1 MAG: hypothetical protein A2336_02885 [Candidatus Peregrinibacteria bacterium RIFOXYB2_FULL_41_88]